MFSVIKGKRGNNSLLYKGKPLHSLMDPLKEAQNIIESQWNETPFVVCIGIGLGYILDVLYEKMDASFDQFHIIAIFLSEEEHRIYISNRKDILNHLSLVIHGDRQQIFEAVENFSDIKRLSFIVTPSFKAQFDDDIKQAQQLVGQFIRYKIQNIATQLELGPLWVSNILYNIPYFLKKQTKIFIDGDVIIAAAGPSLMKQKFFLTQNRGKTVILALDTALGTLYGWGIVPDFVASCDSQYYNYEDFSPLIQYHCKNPHIPKPILLADFTHYHRISAHFERISFFYSEDVADFIVKRLILKNKITKDLPPLLESGGSVASFALGALGHMGASRMILVGQDLRYYKVSHSTGAIAYNDSLYRSHRLNPMINFYNYILFREDSMLNNLTHWMGDFFSYYSLIGIQKDPLTIVDNTILFNEKEHFLKGSYNAIKEDELIKDAHLIKKNMMELLQVVQSLEVGRDLFFARKDLKGEEKRIVDFLLIKVDHSFKHNNNEKLKDHYRTLILRKLRKIRRILEYIAPLL